MADVGYVTFTREVTLYFEALKASLLADRAAPQTRLSLTGYARHAEAVAVVDDIIKEAFTARKTNKSHREARTSNLISLAYDIIEYFTSEASELEYFSRLKVNIVANEDSSEHFRRIFGLKLETSIGQSLAHLEDYLAGVAIIFGTEVGTTQLKKLEEIVPDQDIAPFCFKIVDGRISISDSATESTMSSNEIVSTAQEFLIDAGQELLDCLANSNCDPRILASVSSVHKQIIANGSPVRLGLSNLLCKAMHVEFKHELPLAIAASLSSYSLGIEHYVAQFSDWHTFSTRAAEIESGGLEVEQVTSTIDSLVALLTETPSLADPEVPLSIKLLKEFTANPNATGKRGVYSAVRTIENLISAVYKYATEFIRATIEKSIGEVSNGIAKSIVPLLCVAVTGGAGIGAASALFGSTWVQQAGVAAESLVTSLLSK